MCPVACVDVIIAWHGMAAQPIVLRGGNTWGGGGLQCAQGPTAGQHMLLPVWRNKAPASIGGSSLVHSLHLGHFFIAGQRNDLVHLDPADPELFLVTGGTIRYQRCR